MTAKPVEVDALLELRQQRTGAGRGAALERLPLAVLVDNVRSLWNVGSIFRTADACGVAELVLAGITGCPPRPEISKTALGAEEAVTWRYRAQAREALEQLCDDGYTPVAVENGPGAVPVDDVRWPHRPCLVIGNEVAGVSPQVLEACELQVGIPMRGLKDSLNVAVAFGIAVHVAARALVQSERVVRSRGERLSETDDGARRSHGSHDEET